MKKMTVQTFLSRLAAAAFAVLVTLAVLPSAARAELVIDINQGAAQPMPIAIPAFGGQGPNGAAIADIITDNLERSGLFAPIDRTRFLQQVTDANIQPRFPDWKLVGAQALINGQVAVDPDGRLRVDFRLWDVASEQQLLGVQFTASAASWRRIGHKISDAVYERLTGEKGYFDSRVAYVAESGPKTARRRVLGLMDQDGAGAQLLSEAEGYMVFTPRFSSTNQELTYMALTDSGSRIYLYNLESRRREVLGSFPGMVFAPRFSPDGGRVAFSVERAGNSDIYTMDLRSGASRRITTDPSIDTSPSFDPTGGQIVFNSDRAGSPQLYVMGSDGSGVRRISSGGGRYSTPVWSPTGDLIAFTKQEGGEFHIGVMRPDGSDERILTTSYLDEGPTWAPNGRVLMFFRETPGGEARLWTVDLSGRVLRPVRHGGAASDPAWSPLLE